AGSEAVMDGADPDTAQRQANYTNSVGGCVVVAYDTWLEVRWDERFTGWGFEDVAFWASVDTLYGTVQHPGSIYHLWHPDARGIGSDQYQTGLKLCERYTDARGNPGAIRAILKEQTCVSA